MATVLITGCSSGFGRLTVPRLLERGHTVVAALRGGESRLETIFARELESYPGKLLALDLHMEHPETFGDAILLVNKQFAGKLDVLINNAGYGLFGALEDLGPDQLRHQMNVNFLGPALLTRALLPSLRATRGRVINVSSIAGRHSLPLYGAYNASKFALEGLTEALYHDLKPHGVQVSLLEPGGFKTDFSTRSRIFGETSFQPTSPYLARSEALNHFLARSSARLGNPARVARAIVRLAERRRIPLRKRVGPDAGLLTSLSWLLPERVLLWLVERAFRLVVFRD